MPFEFRKSIFKFSAFKTKAIFHPIRKQFCSDKNIYLFLLLNLKICRLNFKNLSISFKLFAKYLFPYNPEVDFQRQQFFVITSIEPKSLISSTQRLHYTLLFQRHSAKTTHWATIHVLYYLTQWLSNQNIFFVTFFRSSYFFHFVSFQK